VVRPACLAGERTADSLPASKISVSRSCRKTRVEYASLMSVSRPALVSEEEFLALPETMDRVELLDGGVFVSPSPSVWHQELLSRTVHRLRAWAEQSSDAVFIGQAPLDVRFGPGQILQPDAFVILEEISLDLEGPLDRIPDLCVEVLSTNRAYDRLTKRIVYAMSGVRELCCSSPAGRSSAGAARASTKRKSCPRDSPPRSFPSSSSTSRRCFIAADGRAGGELPGQEPRNAKTHGLCRRRTRSVPVKAPGG